MPILVVSSQRQFGSDRLSDSVVKRVRCDHPGAWGHLARRADVTACNLCNPDETVAQPDCLIDPLLFVVAVSNYGLRVNRSGVCR